MDEKDSMTPDTIPQSTPVDGTVPAGRKNRRPVVIGVAAAAAVALVAGGVCGYRAYENHRVSMARQACQSAVTDLGKTVKSYKAARRGCYYGRVEDGCDKREGREDP